MDGLLYFISLSVGIYHLHQCPLHRHPLLHCCRYLFEQDCVHRDSCRSGHQLHPCQSQTGEDCKGAGSCPVLQSIRLLKSSLIIWSQNKRFLCIKNSVTLSSKIPSLSSSLSQASPWPSLSKSSCPELGRLGQLSWNNSEKFRCFTGSTCVDSLHNGLHQMRWQISAEYLLAVISGVRTTHKVLIGPTIQVRVFSTNEAISSITSPTLTLVHWVIEVADVHAFSIFVTVVGLVPAWILGLTHLNEKGGTILWDLSLTTSNIDSSGCALPERERWTFTWAHSSKCYLFYHYSLYHSVWKAAPNLRLRETLKERFYYKIQNVEQFWTQLSL